MNELPPMTLFDMKISTRENLLLKAFLPYVNKDFQPMLAIYIKYNELLKTAKLFSSNANVFSNMASCNSFMDIISVLLPYLSPDERQSFETLGNLQNIMDNLDTYKDIFNEFTNNDNENVCEDNCNQDNDTTASENISDILASFLSPEQQQIFETINGGLNND